MGTTGDEAESQWFQPHPADAPKLAWLARSKEVILEPDLPIVDPHHHLWDARAPLSEVMRPVVDEAGERTSGGAHCATSRPGGAVDPAALGWQKRYTIDDVVADVVSGGHNIVATVFLECGAMFRANGPLELRCVGETEFVSGIASMAASGAYGKCAIAAGIAGTADLTLGAAVEPVLRAHIAAGGGRFRGVRAPFVLDSPTWHEGMKVVESLGLVYDIGCGITQLEEVAQVARAFPDISMVLNHCGGTPGPAAFDSHPEVEAQWRQGISKLAQCKNVFAKVGGIQMTYNGWSDSAGVLLQNRTEPIGSEELATLTYDVYSHVISSFGAERCMWESNFPVDKVCVSYSCFWNAAKLVSKRLGLSPKDKSAIFFGTACKVYGLEISPTTSSL